MPCPCACCVCCQRVRKAPCPSRMLDPAAGTKEIIGDGPWQCGFRVFPTHLRIGQWFWRLGLESVVFLT